MGESVRLLRGVVKNGVIVTDGPPPPDGTAVEFRLLPTAFTPEEQAEYEEWQKLGHHSWQMIDRWEKKMPPGDIVYVNYTAGGGRSQAHRRPAVVLQDDGFAHRSPLVVTIPFTTQATTVSRFPAVIPVSRTPTNGLQFDSFLMVFQVQATDRAFVDAVPIGTLDPAILTQVYDALDRLTGRTNSNPPAPTPGTAP